MDKLAEFWDKFSAIIIAYGGRVVLAIIVLTFGLWLIKRIIKLISKYMLKRDVDQSLRPFLRSLIGGLLRIMLLISVMGMIGIHMTSFIAVLGAAGLAVGLALQGSLANFAGGVLILLLRPFKVGDFIDTGTYSGTVREIQIFYTYITTIHKQEVVIPNGNLSNNAITNYSYHDTRRFDLTIGIGYDDDIDKAKAIINDILMKDGRILKEPEAVVFVEELGKDAVNIHVRAWIKSADFWDVSNGINEVIKKAFDAAGVSFPFPLRNIHIIKPI